MTEQSVNQTNPPSTPGATSWTHEYDPFARGRFPLAGMYELFERTRATKHMVILRRADHGHFGDEVEQQAELCSREQAHVFVRGLTLCHMDAILRRQEAAQRFWVGDVEAELAARGVDVIVPLS